MGECRFIPARDGSEMNTIYQQVKFALKEFGKFFPVAAKELIVDRTTQDRRRWVRICKINADPLEGYVTSADGQVKPSKLEDPEKIRRIKLMIFDGMSLREIEEIEGKLSKYELYLVTGEVDYRPGVGVPKVWKAQGEKNEL